jgi:serine/threonine protein kinase
MALEIGTRLGPFEITASIGAGGIGEVYRARDTRLGRDVALKTLPSDFAQEGERLARFRREAQVLASLNHPNIAHTTSPWSGARLSLDSPSRARSSGPSRSKRWTGPTDFVREHCGEGGLPDLARPEDGNHGVLPQEVPNPVEMSLTRYHPAIMLEKRSLYARFSSICGEKTGRCRGPGRWRPRLRLGHRPGPDSMNITVQGY